jgi:hypothetical protein
MSDVRAASEPVTFFDLYSTGVIPAEAIDDWVGHWHDGAASGTELHDYLGLTLAEYQAWVYDSNALHYILDARRSGRALDQVVRDRLAALSTLGDSTDQTTRTGLRAWLDMHARAQASAA